MSLLLLPPPLLCSRCNLPNCNIERHRTTMPFAYPVCSTCGIELLDLIELYKKPALRSIHSCEICFKRYRPNDDDFYDHFNLHFSKVAARTTAVHCISCVFDKEVTQKNELVCVVSKPIAKIASETRSYFQKTQLMPPKARPKVDPRVLLTRLPDSQIPSSTRNIKIELANEEDFLVRSPPQSPSSFGHTEDTDDDSHSLSDAFSGSSKQTSTPLKKPRKHFVETTHIPNADGKFGCSLCEYSVILRRNLMQHERVKHNINNESKLPNGCPKCPRRFEEKIQLRWHQSRYHKVKRYSYKCRVCYLPPFADAQKLEDHENVIHLNPDTKRWSCRSCSMSFLKPADLRAHEFGHTGIRPYICEKCGFSTKRKEHLERHLESHNDDRPIKCDICPEEKSFKSITNLKVHISHFHQKKHKFSCDKCDRVFTYHSDRRRHLRTHGGIERKHACVLCAKRFYEPKDLRLHMKSHSEK